MHPAAWLLVASISCAAGCSQVLGLDAYSPAPAEDAGTDAVVDSTIGSVGSDGAEADQAKEAVEDSTRGPDASVADAAEDDHANDAVEDVTTGSEAEGVDGAVEDQANDVGHDGARDGSPGSDGAATTDAPDKDVNTSPTSDGAATTCPGAVPAGADTCCGASPCVGRSGNACNCASCEQQSCANWCCFGSQGNLHCAPGPGSCH
jgi:hypothetical protein